MFNDFCVINFSICLVRKPFPHLAALTPKRNVLGREWIRRKKKPEWNDKVGWMKCSPTARSRGHAGATTIIKFITPPEWGGTTTTLTRQNPTLMIACSQNAPCLLLCYVALLKCAYGGILMLPRRDLSTHAQSRDVCTLKFFKKELPAETNVNSCKLFHRTIWFFS